MSLLIEVQPAGAALTVRPVAAYENSATQMSLAATVEGKFRVTLALAGVVVAYVFYMLRPEIPAASSRTWRRSVGLALIRAATRPWLTSAGDCAPTAASANNVCTSRARTERPDTR